MWAGSWRPYRVNNNGFPQLRWVPQNDRLAPVAEWGSSTWLAPPSPALDEPEPRGSELVRDSLTHSEVPCILDAVEVAAGARKHGIPDANILRAWRNALRVAEQDYCGESRVIAVGPARDGALLELVLVPDDVPTRVIHADQAPRSFLDRLR